MVHIRSFSSSIRFKMNFKVEPFCTRTSRTVESTHKRNSLLGSMWLHKQIADHTTNAIVAYIWSFSAMTKCKPLSFYINIILISSSVQEVAFEWISSWNAQIWIQWSVDWFWGIKSMHGIGYSPSSARHASLSALSAFPRKIRLLSPTYTTF
jgi:hypothetical protein